MLTGPGGATIAIYAAVMLMPLFILWGLVDRVFRRTDSGNGPRDGRDQGPTGLSHGAADRSAPPPCWVRTTLVRVRSDFRTLGPSSLGATAGCEGRSEVGVGRGPVSLGPSTLSGAGRTAAACDRPVGPWSPPSIGPVTVHPAARRSTPLQTGAATTSGLRAPHGERGQRQRVRRHRQRAQPRHQGWYRIERVDVDEQRLQRAGRRHCDEESERGTDVNRPQQNGADGAVNRAVRPERECQRQDDDAVYPET